MNALIVGSLEANTAALKETLCLYNQEQFNTLPFADSWTAAETAQHLLKAESGVFHVISGSTEPLNRDAAEKNETLDHIFLDFSTKMKSPKEIIPDPGPKNQHELMDALFNNRERIIQFAGTHSLDALCRLSEFPGQGYMSIREWLHFMEVHATRHTLQMQRIWQAL